tara:strand:- start:1484 stop:1753 length:270 start_codon:yes stop_codon:yes gene_type:complete
MSTETLIKENFSNPKFKLKGLEKTRSDSGYSNVDLNKLENKKFKKIKSKICINNLHNKLRKKEVKEKFENRIILGLFVSAIAVIFYVST